MFWGLIMEPNKRYSQTVAKSFHVSMASLDTTTANDKQVQVILCYEDRTYLLCSLQRDSTWQVPLDLNFQEGSKIAFTCNGHGHVHLTGYLIPEETLDFDDEEEDEEEDKQVDSSIEKQSKRKAQKPLKNEKKAKQSKQEEEAESSGDDEALELDEDDDSEDSEMELDAAPNVDEEGSGDEDEDDEDEDEEEDEDEDEDEDDEDDDEEEEPPKKKVRQQKDKKNKQQQQQQQQQVQQQQKKKDDKKKLVNGSDAKQEQQQPNKDQKKKKGEQQQQQKQQQQQNAQNAQNEPKKRVVEGGIQVEDLKIGNGAPAKPGKFVSVYYVGRLKNGKKFDSATQGDGFKFRLGKGEVIKGWDIGLVGMKPGGKRRLTIPPAMAYGAQGSPPIIPGNSTLIFEVELKNVH